MAQSEQIALGIATINREVGLVLDGVAGGGEAGAPGFALVALDAEGHAVPTSRLPGRASGAALDGEERVGAEGEPDRPLTVGRGPALHDLEPQHADVEPLRAGQILD